MTFTPKAIVAADESAAVPLASLMLAPIVTDVALAPLLIVASSFDH
jgi:hypothetical protein